MQSAKKREIEWKRRERRRKRRRRRKIKGRGRIDSPFGSIVKILKIIARRVIYCRLPITELSRAPRLHWLIEPSDSLLIPSSFLRHSPYMCVSPARACDAILYFARAIKKKNATTSHLYGRSVQFAARYRVIPPLITRVYTQIINSRAQGKLSHRYIIYTCSECNLYYNSAKKVRNSAFFRFCLAARIRRKGEVSGQRREKSAQNFSHEGESSFFCPSPALYDELSSWKIQCRYFDSRFLSFVRNFVHAVLYYSPRAWNTFSVFYSSPLPIQISLNCAYSVSFFSLRVAKSSISALLHWHVDEAWNMRLTHFAQIFFTVNHRCFHRRALDVFTHAYACMRVEKL